MSPQRKNSLNGHSLSPTHNNPHIIKIRQPLKNYEIEIFQELCKLTINIVTDLLKALLGNGSINTPRPTCTQQ
jgi:hypothetical protein